MYSVEHLVHFQCPLCSGWWSIGDAPIDTEREWYCPWCGSKKHYSCREDLIKEASALLDEDNPRYSKLIKMKEKLVAEMSPEDDFLFNWRSICKQKGWLK